MKLESDKPEREWLPSHVEILSSTESGEFPHEWYELSDAAHFWFHWRFRVFMNLLAATGIDTNESARAFDIGCGTGILRDQIEARSQWIVDGADLQIEALIRSNPGRGRFYRYDIFDRDPRMTGQYDYLFLFDVIEHIVSTQPFIETALAHLRPGGFLFVNVPALEILMSGYDRAAGHLRRYSISTLRREFSGQPVSVERATYWGFSLLPLLAVRKIVVGAMSDSAGIIRSGFAPPAQWMNGLLRRVAEVETSVVRRPPGGTSVMMALRKVR